MARIAVIADDLSGAVETAASFLLRTTRITVTLAARPASLSGGAEELPDVHVHDTDSRELAPADAAERVTAAAAVFRDAPVLIKKVDSLLRGNVAAELLALRAARPRLVVAPALPATGRTVRDGRVWVGDRLLHETDVWRAEAGEKPLSIAAVLAPLPTTSVSLEVVRGPGLAARLREILDAAFVPVCDAETDDDLDRIVLAVEGPDRPVLVGSAGIAGAVARNVAALAGTAERPAVGRNGRVLAVVGSAAPAIASQLEELRAAGVPVELLRPVDLIAAAGDTAVLAALVARIDALDGPLAVVAVDAADGVDPGAARILSRTLAAAVSDAADRSAGLVLTGGETARAVLDRLGVALLRPLSQVHHGAVVCVDDAGRAVATRPGSFGDRNSLLHLVSAVREVVAAGGPAATAAVRPVPNHASPHPPEESA